MEIYLDNAATTKVCPEALEAATLALTDNYGNPSSLHSLGIAASQTIEASRRQIAEILGVLPEEISFSPSGTLANNIAVIGAVNMRKHLGKRIVTSAIEHPSVSRIMDSLEDKGFEVVRLLPTLNGAVDPEALMNAVNDKTILISLMYVNNETGAVNPVEYMAKAARAAKARALLHVDAIQAFGKMNVKPKKLGLDFLSISGHKIHAPKGTGALYVKKGYTVPYYIYGGKQEHGLFSGTENVPAIAGFGAAAAALPPVNELQSKMKLLRHRLIDRLEPIPSIHINSPKNGLPSIVNLSILGMPSQVLVNFFSERGFCVSAGSACKKGNRSDVLTYMGVPDTYIDSSIRVSFSRYTTMDEVNAFADAAIEASTFLKAK